MVFLLQQDKRHKTIYIIITMEKSNMKYRRINIKSKQSQMMLHQQDSTERINLSARMFHTSSLVDEALTRNLIWYL